MTTHQNEGLVFFTDLSGFGRTTKGMEPEKTADLLTTFAEITDQTAKESGGTIVQYMLDSALGFFPAEKADEGVKTLLKMKGRIEEKMKLKGFKMKLRVAGHYGDFLKFYLPPFETPNILGETVNRAIRLGSGGQSSHRGRLILTAQAFRKLEPETRKQFHKFTEPIVYLAN